MFCHFWSHFGRFSVLGRILPPPPEQKMCSQVFFAQGGGRILPPRYKSPKMVSNGPKFACSNNITCFQSIATHSDHFRTISVFLAIGWPQKTIFRNLETKNPKIWEKYRFIVLNHLIGPQICHSNR